MKVVRKICIRPRVNRTVRSDVLRPCLGLIVNLVSRYYKDQQTVTVIVLSSFVSKIDRTLYIKLRHTAKKDTQTKLLSYVNFIFILLHRSCKVEVTWSWCTAELNCLIFLQIEVHQELDLPARLICKLLKEQKRGWCTRIWVDRKQQQHFVSNILLESPWDQKTKLNA